MSIAARKSGTAVGGIFDSCHTQRLQTKSHPILLLLQYYFYLFIYLSLISLSSFSLLFFVLFVCWLLAHDERLRVAMKGNGSDPGATHHLSLGRLYFILIYTSAGNVANIRAEQSKAKFGWVGLGLVCAQWQPSTWSCSSSYQRDQCGHGNRAKHPPYMLRNKEPTKTTTTWSREKNETKSRPFPASPFLCRVPYFAIPSANDFSPDITARSWMACSRSFSFSIARCCLLLCIDRQAERKKERGRLLGKRPVVTLLLYYMYVQLYISAVSLFLFFSFLFFSYCTLWRRNDLACCCFRWRPRSHFLTIYITVVV